MKRRANRPEADTPALESPRPQTMVDFAVSAIISGAARGVILPGDRIVETDLSESLGMSRVPIREALRLLESQGVVTSEPYKGIRLVELTQKRLREVLDVRVNLETLAARRAIEAGANDNDGLERLRLACDELGLRARLDDSYAFASADAAFHRILVGLAGNPVLSGLWESLAKQVTIVVGLSTLSRPMKEIVEEHDLLIEVFGSGDIPRMESALNDHIVVLSERIDFDAVIQSRRAERESRAAPTNRAR